MVWRGNGCTTVREHLERLFAGLLPGSGVMEGPAAAMGAQVAACRTVWLAIFVPAGPIGARMALRRCAEAVAGIR